MNKLIAARFLNASIPITKIEEWGGGGGNGRRIFLVKNRPVGCRRILIAGRLKSILNSKNGLLSLESRIGRPVMLIGDSGREKKKKKGKYSPRII